MIDDGMLSLGFVSTSVILVVVYTSNHLVGLLSHKIMR